jgi:bifunctional N-acetylglucosamine-1-phosphate-uridyltransferase/glucosamine-1-phosphate-acetyltransferase GlmU-like protein
LRSRSHHDRRALLDRPIRAHGARDGELQRRSATSDNFVEVKNSVIGDGSKANHLTYIGDCDRGEERSTSAPAA